MARPGERRALFIIGPGRPRLVVDAADVALISHTPRSVTGGARAAVADFDPHQAAVLNCNKEGKNGAPYREESTEKGVVVHRTDWLHWVREAKQTGAALEEPWLDSADSAAPSVSSAK